MLVIFKRAILLLALLPVVLTEEMSPGEVPGYVQEEKYSAVKEAYKTTKDQVLKALKEKMELDKKNLELEKELENVKKELQEKRDQDETLKLDTKISDCKKYTEAYRVAACASGLLRDQLIDNTEYQHFLFDSMRKAKAEETSYYSCGVEWGDDRSIICGRQDIYEFDSVYGKIPLRLPYLGKQEKIMHRVKSSKPRLLYSFSDIDAPEFSPDTWRLYRPKAIGRLSHLWRAESSKKLTTLPNENCAGVDNKAVKLSSFGN